MVRNNECAPLGDARGWRLDRVELEREQRAQQRCDDDRIALALQRELVDFRNHLFGSNFRLTLTADFPPLDSELCLVGCHCHKQKQNANMNEINCKTVFDDDDATEIDLARKLAAAPDRQKKVRIKLKRWCEAQRPNSAGEFERHAAPDADQLLENCGSAALPLCVVAQAVELAGDLRTADELRALCRTCRNGTATPSNELLSEPTSGCNELFSLDKHVLPLKLDKHIRDTDMERVRAALKSALIANGSNDVAADFDEGLVHSSLELFQLCAKSALTVNQVADAVAVANRAKANELRRLCN